MDIYSAASDFLLTLPIVQGWPQVATLWQRAAGQHDPNWALPAIACQAVGGSAQQAVPAVAALGGMQLAIILIDDMLDDDPRGEYHRLGQPATANLAAAFAAASLAALGNSSAPQAARLAALEALNTMMFQTCFGQDLDGKPIQDEEAYWKVVEAKSSPYFASAFEIGALLGGADLPLAAQLKTLGGLYGEIVQVYDDVHDTLAQPANPDWVTGRSPLPILFAATVTHPERARFENLRGASQDPTALAEAQAILVRSGAVSYSLAVLMDRHQQASDLLAGLALPNRDVLEKLLAESIQPVNSLLAKLN